MKALFFLFMMACSAANAQSQSHYLYNSKLVPFELNFSENAKNDTLPTFTWFASYHFILKNVGIKDLVISVSPPFALEKMENNAFQISANLPADSAALKQYLSDSIACIYVKSGRRTVVFKTKVQAVPYFRTLLFPVPFSPDMIDTAKSFIVQGVWERPPCASYHFSRFAGHFHTALFDSKGNVLQQNDGWYDTNDSTREYSLSAAAYHLQKGDIVELRIDSRIPCLFRGFPEWIKPMMQKKLKISPTQALSQRFSLQ